MMQQHMKGHAGNIQLVIHTQKQSLVPSKLTDAAKAALKVLTDMQAQYSPNRLLWRLYQATVELLWLYN